MRHAWRAMGFLHAAAFRAPAKPWPFNHGEAGGDKTRRREALPCFFGVMVDEVAYCDNEGMILAYRKTCMSEKHLRFSEWLAAYWWAAAPALMGVGIGVLLCVQIASRNAQIQMFREQGVAAEAEVVMRPGHLDGYYFRDETGFGPRVSVMFRVKEGKGGRQVNHAWVDAGAEEKELKPGDRIKILYLPERPEQARLMEEVESYQPYGMQAVTGMVFAFSITIFLVPMASWAKS